MTTDSQIQHYCNEFYINKKTKAFPCFGEPNLIIYLVGYYNYAWIRIIFKNINQEIRIDYNSLNELINQVKLILTAYL